MPPDITIGVWGNLYKQGFFLGGLPSEKALQ